MGGVCGMNEGGGWELEGGAGMAGLSRLTITVAGRRLGMTYRGVCGLIAEGRLEEGGDVRGVRTVTAESLDRELERRVLPALVGVAKEGVA